MTVSLLLFLALYLVVLIVFVLFSAIALYHLQRFGYADRETVGFTVLFFALAAVIIGGTVLALLGIDWQQGVEIGVPSFPAL